MANHPASKPILLLEDDSDLAANIVDFLELKGWLVDYAPTGALALHKVLSESFSAAIFDINVPGIDGIDLCERIRASTASSLPIIILTAADQIEQRLSSFQAGADDYMPKPFSLDELEARLNALVRRSKGGTPPFENILSFGDISINLATREVTHQSRPLQLTRMGYQLLKLIIQEAPRVVERDEIERVLWHGLPPASDALRSHVASLRTALNAPHSQVELVTHRGVGYQIKESRSTLE